MIRRRRRRLPPSIQISRRWRRTWPGLLVALIVAGVVGYDHWRHGPAPDAAAVVDFEQRLFRVVYVADGDTFDIDQTSGGKSQTRIRLWGVDTPEIAHGSSPTMHFGPEAKSFAERTLAGQMVQVRVLPDRLHDRFGRLLAFVHVGRDGPMFNEMLLQEGYGYADTRFDHPQKDRFIELERAARNERLGLWKDLTPLQMPKWRQKKRAWDD